jgi:hypothetical protein
MFMFMSIEWDYVSELRPPMFLLLTPTWYVYGEPQWNDIDREKPKNSYKNIFQCDFVHHKCHLEWAGHKPGPLQWEYSN